MHRTHTPELEDAPWFPAWMRDDMTRLLVVLGKVIRIPEAVTPILQRALAAQGTQTVVDLGSGAGGTMPLVLRHLRGQPGFEATQLVLTDKYPNEGAQQQLREAPQDGVSYLSSSVDATHLEKAPTGVKTMVNCFHHMRPDQAKAILSSAARTKQPLVIYEMADNTFPFAVWLLALPLGLLSVFLSALVFTPFVRPLTVRQLVFTYLIPLLPLCYAWDGQASGPRIYGLADLEELLRDVPSDGYTWEKGPALLSDGKARGIYLLGLPEAQAAEDPA